MGQFQVELQRGQTTFPMATLQIDLLCQITILPTKMSDFHRQSEFKTIVNG
jgi:hypothetical protein